MQGLPPGEAGESAAAGGAVREWRAAHDSPNGQPRDAAGRDPGEAERLLRETRAALAASEERLRNLIERNADGVVIVDVEGNVLFLNPACERLLGRPASHLLGQPFGFPCVAGSTAEVDVLRPGGEAAAAEMRVVETFWEGKPACLATLRDVTERKSLEEQLRQSQKMEAIGRLAGGIAHDFNNILTAIQGYADLALSRLSPGAAPQGGADCDVLRHDVAEIKHAAERAANVTRQLLSFSRKHLTQAEVFDLREAVAGMEGMLRRVLGENVELGVTRGPGPCRVKADRGQIEQVILNLAVNARDAMPEGGRLLITTCDVAPGHCGAEARGGPTDRDYVLLTVSDSGRGIEPALLPRIFEPFFTTKGPDRGTGLGLSIVYGIVQQCAGQVLVDSEPDRGTRFRIFLPRWDGPLARPAAAPAPARAAGGATVLLVEDRDDVRTVTRRMLQKSGYTVVEAADGMEAMDLSDRRAEPLDLLVTDVVMPGMSGRELAERLAPRRPGMKILFMSGFTRDEILPEGGEGTSTAFIQKPFTLDQLLAKVAEMLSSRPRQPRQ